MGVERRVLAAIFLGGCAGTMLRAGLADLLPRTGDDWPWATLLVNVTGAALLGWWAIRTPPAAARRPLLTTGFCGGLTTFSALQLELLRFLDDGRLALAAGYVAASVAAGLLAVAVAVAWARRTDLAR